MIWQTLQGDFLVQGKAFEIVYARSVRIRGRKSTESYKYYLIDSKGVVLKHFSESRFCAVDDYGYVTSIHIVIEDVLYDYMWVQQYGHEEKLDERITLDGLRTYTLPIPFDVEKTIENYERAEQSAADEYYEKHIAPWEDPQYESSSYESNFHRDDQGRTPLFDAAQNGNKPAVGAILRSERGTGLFPPRLALIQITDKNGLCAADVAEQAGHLEIAERLRAEESRMFWSE
jgi:hypothetical protein